MTPLSPKDLRFVSSDYQKGEGWVYGPIYPLGIWSTEAYPGWVLYLVRSLPPPLQGPGPCTTTGQGLAAGKPLWVNHRVIFRIQGRLSAVP